MPLSLRKGPLRSDKGISICTFISLKEERSLWRGVSSCQASHGTTCCDVAGADALTRRARGLSLFLAQHTWVKGVVCYVQRQCSLLGCLD